VGGRGPGGASIRSNITNVTHIANITRRRRTITIVHRVAALSPPVGIVPAAVAAATASVTKVEIILVLVIVAERPPSLSTHSTHLDTVVAIALDVATNTVVPVAVIIIIAPPTTTLTPHRRSAC
jgi:hypothetical protein